MKLFITKSKRKNKTKYDLLDDNKIYILSFGDARFEDYTMHKDPDRKERYINRHKNEKYGLLRVLKQRGSGAGGRFGT